MAKHKQPSHSDRTSPQNKPQDSAEYQAKRAFYDSVLTIYGRKPVLEALQDRSLNIHRLHLADSNREEADVLQKITQLAQQRGIETLWHNKQALSRISKNAKQDQGVALDIVCQLHGDMTEFLVRCKKPNTLRLLALDGVTNPQNIGMIIRSAVAGGMHGLLLPQKGCAALGPLVIKASAGTLFKMPIIRCQTLPGALQTLSEHGIEACCLAADARLSLFDYQPSNGCVYVLGSESDGVSAEVSRLCQQRISIPMQHGVESLNVAITAALIAYQPQL